MPRRPQRTVFTFRTFACFVAGGIAVGAAVGGIAPSLYALSNEALADLLRFSMYAGGIIGAFVWIIAANQEAERREIARLRQWRWNEPLREDVAISAEKTAPSPVRTQWLSHLALGGGIGSACGMIEAILRILEADSRWLLAIIAATGLGVLAGAVVWLVRLIDEDSRATSVRGRDPLESTKEPPWRGGSFETRLAGFLHCDVAELREVRPRPASKMPFWSLVDFRSYIGPKPVELIRAFLERIHAAVHGPSHHDGNAAR